MAKALLNDTAVSTWAGYQPLSAKQEHNRRSCLSPARYSCISTAIRIKIEIIPGPNSLVDQGGASTANSKAIASLAQLHITSAV